MSARASASRRISKYLTRLSRIVSTGAGSTNLSSTRDWVLLATIPDADPKDAPLRKVPS